MIKVPLSRVGSADAFAQKVQQHVRRLTAHMMGKPGNPMPRADELIELVIQRQPDTGPVAKRGPDKFVVLPYEIIDDTPRTPEQQQAIDTLRATIK